MVPIRVLPRSLTDDAVRRRWQDGQSYLANRPSAVLAQVVVNLRQLRNGMTRQKGVIFFRASGAPIALVEAEQLSRSQG